MRRLTTVVLAAGLGIAAQAAIADDDTSGMTPYSSLDAYVTYQDQDLRTVDAGDAVRIDDSDFGGGLRARLAFGDYLFLSGGFQSVSINNPDASFEGDPSVDGSGVTIRFREQLYEAGLRYRLMDGMVTLFGSVGDYRPVIRVNNFAGGSGRFADSGFAWAVGGKLSLMNGGLHVSGTYRNASGLDDADFDEFVVRVVQRFSHSLGVFVEYRRGELDFDGDGGSFDVNDFRLGMRFSFGGGARDDDFF